MRWLSILSLSALLANCSANYHLSKERIKGYWPIENSFELAKIAVQKIDSVSELPIKYDIEEKFICMISYEDTDPSKDDFDMKTPSKKSGKSVFFFKEQDQVRWINPGDSNKVYRTLPITFEPQTWYKLSDLYPESYDMTYTLYFYLDKDLKLKAYHKNDMSKME